MRTNFRKLMSWRSAGPFVIWLTCCTTLAQVSSAVGLTATFSNGAGQGLEIVSAAADCAATHASNFRIVVRNSGTKSVVAYAVQWRLTTAAGTPSTTDTWASLFKNGKAILPGETHSLVTKASLTTPSAAPFVKVEASLDYIEFADGTSSGPDTTRVARELRVRRQTIEGVHRRLLRIYEEKGLEALLAEIR